MPIHDLVPVKWRSLRAYLGELFVRHPLVLSLTIAWSEPGPFVYPVYPDYSCGFELVDHRLFFESVGLIK